MTRFRTELMDSALMREALLRLDIATNALRRFDRNHKAARGSTSQFQIQATSLRR